MVPLVFPAIATDARQQFEPDIRTPGTLDLGKTYMFKARTQMVSGVEHYYFKMWAAGTAEPASWGLQFAATSGPTSGGVVIFLHHLNGAVGDVTVTPLAGS